MRSGINSDYERCKLSPEEIFVRVLKSQGAASLDFYYNIFGYMIDVDPKELAQDKEIERRLLARLRRERLQVK